MALCSSQHFIYTPAHSLHLRNGDTGVALYVEQVAADKNALEVKSCATTQSAIWADVNGSGHGVCGSSNGPGTGVWGSNSSNGTGVKGTATGAYGYGVLGVATNTDSTATSTGVHGDGGFRGVYARCSSPVLNAAALVAFASGGAKAGVFTGNVSIAGTLTKTAGTFTIDHPLDPENKILNHSFVESPEMMNVYRGTVDCDSLGSASVTLPSYFDALNSSPCYQLTAIGAAAPGLHVASEVVGNVFRVAGGPPSGRVSWTVTGARKDAYALANPVVVEVDKTEKGKYLNPECFGKGEEYSVSYAAFKV